MIESFDFTQHVMNRGSPDPNACKITLKRYCAFVSDFVMILAALEWIMIVL